jgi:hypothetical protein
VVWLDWHTRNKVPYDAGFGRYSYGEMVLEWSYIAPTMRRYGHKMRAYYPSYISALETGARRGWVLLIPALLAREVEIHFSDEWVRTW